ncbi:MAG: hypothetical protein ABI342_03750 [Nitrososphaera sp.]|jgi:hypothetical protein
MDILQAQGEMMIDELLNFLLGVIDDTWNNDEDADTRLKICELEKLRRK